MGQDDEEEGIETDHGFAPQKGVGRETLHIVLEQIEKANVRSAAASQEAIDAVIKSNQSSNQRIFLIVLSLLLLFAAILGIATTVDIPGIGTIGVEPEAVGR